MELPADLLQIERSSDVELKALANLVMGKAEIELALDASDASGLGGIHSARTYRF